jgi:prevent-host-death family protein
MSELRVALDEILPIKEAARGLARVLDRLEQAEAQHIVITRRSKPQAVVVAVERYEALLRAEARHPVGIH